MYKQMFILSLTAIGTINSGYTPSDYAMKNSSYLRSIAEEAKSKFNNFEASLHSSPKITQDQAILNELEREYISAEMEYLDALKLIDGVEYISSPYGGGGYYAFKPSAMGPKYGARID